MADNNYDEACRFQTRRAGGPMVNWLLGMPPTKLRFDGWLDSVLTLPGTKERVCDAVARLADLGRNGLPFAAILEFQTRPDPDMFGRLMVAGGLCWLTTKPADLPGDRYELTSLVVNLTGRGTAARSMKLETTEWTLTPREVNFEALNAEAVLNEIALGAAPREALCWIPLMQRGDEAAIIERWLETEASQKGVERPLERGAAILFAGLVGRFDMWWKSLDGDKVIDVPIVTEWKNQARREAKTDWLLRVLRVRFGMVQDTLAARIGANDDPAKFDRWLDSAATAATIEQFRQECGL